MNDAGLHSRMREAASKTANEASHNARAAEQGAKLAARYEATERDYGSFYDMLDTQNNQPDGSSSLPIALSQDHDQRYWGRGALVARFSRDTDSYYFESPRFHTEVDFVSNDNSNRSELVLNEFFGAAVTSAKSPEKREALREGWPGIVFIPEEYTPDTVEWLKDQLTEVIPVARETFNLLLGHACDPVLNPDLAEAAQDYRRDLLAGVVGVVYST